MFARLMLTLQPDIDAAVAGARARAIPRCREESVVTASRGTGMCAMQIGDAIIGTMTVIFATRLIIIKARIVVDSIVRPALLCGFATGGEREGGQKQRSGSSNHVGLRRTDVRWGEHAGAATSKGLPGASISCRHLSDAP